MPCYNEARRLDVSAFRAFLSQNSAIRLLFVDDGSRDATLEVLGQVCAGYEANAAVLAKKPNAGKAEAVRAGVLHAIDSFRPKFVGFWDADLATPLDAIVRFRAVLEEHSEIEMIFGSRVQLLGRHVERRPARHYLGRVFATAVSVLLAMPIYDSQCGAKLFRADQKCRTAFEAPFLSKWVFDVEILARYLNLYERDSSRLAQVIYEYPLEKWTDVAGSKVRAGDFVKAFADVVRIRRKYL